MNNNFLTAAEARIIEKATTDALKLIFEKHDGRDRGSIAEVENPNRQVRKSDCEKAISGLHRRHDPGRAVAKAAPATTNASAAIAAMHSDRSLAGRTVSGNRGLVEKLAGAVAVAVRKDYSSAAEAKREIKKMLAEDAPRPGNHEIVKRAKAKSGEAVMTFRKGNDYPYLIEVDGCYHSEHADADRAERTFVILCAGAN
jgi:hypothetical protein